MARSSDLYRPARVGGQRAGLLVALLTLVVNLVIFEGDRFAQTPGADGFYSWIVARSVAFDFDLHFANDYKLCGDPWHNGIDRGGGRPDDPFYVGPAVYWVPALWLARAVIRLPPSAPPNVVGACVGPRTGFALHLAPLLGALSVFLFYRIARRFVDRDGPAALSAALFGLASNLLAYATVLPSYSHVYATFAVACLALSSLRAYESGTLRRWGLVAAALVVCMLQRSSCVIFVSFPAGLAFLAWRRDRPRGLAGLVPLALVGAAALTGVAILLSYYRLLYGSMWIQPQGENYAHVGHGHPWLMLFGVRGGLFFTAPATWLAVIGAVQLVRGRDSRALAIVALVPCALEIYVSSLPLDWDSACTFGARRLTTLLPFFALFAVRPIDDLRAYFTARPQRAGAAIGVAAALPLLFSNFGAVWGLPRGKVPLCDAPTQEKLYGEGAAVTWSLLDEIGDVSVLPLSLAFRLRFGLPMSALRDATQPFYVRHYRDLTWVIRELKMTDPVLGRLGRGLVFDKAGARLAARHASLVFTAQWPFATTTTLHVTAERPARLRMGNRPWIGRTRWYGEISVQPGTRDYTLAVPPDAFDSGVQELSFEADRTDAGVVIEKISFDDETPRVPIRAR